jgi:hypothetical protein
MAGLMGARRGDWDRHSGFGARRGGECDQRRDLGTGLIGTRPMIYQRLRSLPSVASDAAGWAQITPTRLFGYRLSICFHWIKNIFIKKYRHGNWQKARLLIFQDKSGVVRDMHISRYIVFYRTENEIITTDSCT